MACNKRHCSGCGSCRRNSFARVNYPDVSTCADQNSSSCSCNCGGCRPHWHHHCGSGCNSCNSCGCSSNCNNGCNRPPVGVPWNGVESSNFGLLRSVPNYRYLRRNWDDFPFYNGPCGPCENECCSNNCCSGNCSCGGCDSCCHHGCRPPWPAPVPPEPVPVPDCCHAGAVFTSAAPVQLSAGGNVAFTADANNPDGFSVSSGGISIENEGTYMVIYTVNVPANAALSSRFVLSLDGSNIPASAMDVTAVADDGTSSSTMSAIIQASAGSVLNLRSLSPVSINTGTASNVFTLTIINIC